MLIFPYNSGWFSDSLSSRCGCYNVLEEPMVISVYKFVVTAREYNSPSPTVVLAIADFKNPRY
jgi:hypothetical protein